MSAINDEVEDEPQSLDDLDGQSDPAAPRGPYAAAALAYYRSGWRGILPIPPRSKALKMSGYTGRDGTDPSYPDVTAWVEDRADWNVALHMPTHLDYEIVGIDVDAYDGKPGGSTLAALEAELGPLPATWRSTSRDDGISGIRLYRIPKGMHWPGRFGDGIDCISVVHRYAVVAPSIHPEGRTYRWVAPDGTAVIGFVPRPQDMAELPVEWIERFTSGELDADRPKASLAAGGAWAWLEAHNGAGQPCHKVAAEMNKPIDPSGRHEWMLARVNTLVGYGAEGHHGAVVALRQVHDAFLAAVAPDRPHEAEMEFWRAVDGAVAAAIGRNLTPPPMDPCRTGGLDGLVAPEQWPQALADAQAAAAHQPTMPSGAGGEQDGGPAMGSMPDEQQARSAFDLERDEFWQSRPELAHIRQFARARLASPWAALGKVLVQVVGRIEPNVVLPPIIGGDASLNLFVGLVGDSGTGKGASEGVAHDCLIYNVHGLAGVDLAELNAGSGEGIASTYQRFLPGKGRDENGELKPGHVEQIETRALFHVGEVDALGALKGRSGSTLLTELRGAWSGEALGFAYADQTRRLPLKPHTYRLCLTVGIQPGRAAVLLDDADGGTPQRFVWLPSRDPGISDITPEVPDPMPWSHPWVGMPPGQPRMAMDVCEAARETIRRAAIARHRGEVDALDGHSLLCRLKVAAALAILHGGTAVADEDWALAGIVMDVSDRTRAGVQRDLASRHEDAARARGRTDAIRQGAAEEVLDEKATKRVAKTIVRHLGSEWQAHSKVRKGITGRDRKHFDEAIRRLIDVGTVEADRAGNSGLDGLRYRLADGTNS